MKLTPEMNCSGETMHKKEGIVDTMEDHWRVIDAEFNQVNARYLTIAAMDHEMVGRILRAHLIIENFLNSYLVDLFGLENFGELRLTFSQKAKMLPKSKFNAAWIRPGILQLNAVRNKYGHQIDHTVHFSDISAIMEFLSVSRSGQEFGTPIEAIEAFVPVACAFLTVAPQHVSDALAQVSKHINA